MSFDNLRLNGETFCSGTYTTLSFYETLSSRSPPSIFRRAAIYGSCCTSALATHTNGSQLIYMCRQSFVLAPTTPEARLKFYYWKKERKNRRREKERVCVLWPVRKTLRVHVNYVYDADAPMPGNWGISAGKTTPRRCINMQKIHIYAFLFVRQLRFN